MMKTVFMGTPDFAAEILKTMLDAGQSVCAVFTQPDRPKGRSGKPQRTPVRELAESFGIPVYTPAKIRTEENVEILRALAPDVIVVAAFGQILPASILNLPRFGCINVHASLLPAYRGAAPIQWAVIDGAKESGVTTMRMDEGLDTGDMIMKTVVPIAEDETGGSLFDKLAAAGGPLLLETLKALEEGTAVFEKQPRESTTHYASMLTRSSGEIDWSLGAAALERRVRGLSPWPGSFTHLDGKTLKIWGCAPAAEDLPFAGSGQEGLPGTVYTDGRGRLAVQTGEGLLEILELQLEGKRRMQAGEFLRGYRLKEGTVLC